MTPAEDHWNAQRYESAARFVSDLGAPVVDLLAPRKDETILDLGCGDAALSLRIAEAGARVIGYDASPDMVRAARLRGIEAEVADGHDFRVADPVDAVFSNAALHWMTAPDRVIACAHAALKSGGRFVAEFGGFGNVAAIRTALVAALGEEGIATDLSEIWYFPTVSEHEARLRAGGFEVTEIALIPRQTRIDAGMRRWLETLAAPALARAGNDAARERILDRATALLTPALRDGDGVWWADYVRLRFKAVRL